MSTLEKREILELIIKNAISSEEKGARFYAAMAEKAESERIKSIFEKLSAEEKEHKKAFEKILGIEMAGAGGEIDEREGKLLVSLINTSAFQGMKEGSWGATTPVEALAIGIQAEKDSILLYQGVYNQSSSQDVKNMMSRLLEEEKMHLVELREEMEYMVNNRE